MTIFYSHQDRLSDQTGMKLLIRRALSRMRAVLGIVHGAIVTARTRRLQRELRFYDAPRDDWSSDRDKDPAKVAQRPLILGDKWDF
jgi:hypothetical protein